LKALPRAPIYSGNHDFAALDVETTSASPRVR